MATADGGVKLQQNVNLDPGIQYSGQMDGMGRPLQNIDLNVRSLMGLEGIHAAEVLDYLQMELSTHNVHTIQFNMATAWLQSDGPLHHGSPNGSAKMQ